jgi:hypothetical protein
MRPVWSEGCAGAVGRSNSREGPSKKGRILAGAFAACPAAGELIHEAVLAMKLAAPVCMIADAIHAFPTGARAFGNLMAEAAKQLK